MVTVLDRSTLRLRPWERGAGLTEACGSGACAAVAAAHGWGSVDGSVEVRMPGGTAVVTVGSPMVLSVPSVFVDEHEVDNG
jgi:diaminopimelate epimerase